VGGEVLTLIGEEGFDWDGREAEGKEGRKEGRRREERRGRDNCGFHISVSEGVF
jgi:hypothetical protein